VINVLFENVTTNRKKIKGMIAFGRKEDFPAEAQPNPLAMLIFNMSVTI